MTAATANANRERNAQERNASQSGTTEIKLDFTRSLITTPEGARQVAGYVERGLEQVLGQNARIF